MHLLDGKETAARLGIQPNTLSKWRITGAGPAFIRVGRSIKYDPADVQVWLESRKAHSTSEVA